MLRDDLLEKHKVRQVNTAWNDSYPIDWDWMQKGLNETMSKADQNCSFHWFLIDEITHGSVTTFPSKEIFEACALEEKAIEMNQITKESQ